MEEKYFIIDIKNRECGAFTEAELNDIGLFEDSLIFCSDWSERKPLNQIPELSHIKRKEESIFSLNEFYGQYITPVKQISKDANISKQKKETGNPFSFKKKNVRIVVVSWFFFHIMALFYNSILRLHDKVYVYKNGWSSNYLVRDVIWPTKIIYKQYDGLHFDLFRGYDKSEFIGYNLIFGFVWFILYTFKQKS
jgi:hypothetical protein